MTFLLMHSGVARSAQGLKVFEVVVTLLSRGSNAKTVNVMNVQVVLTAAALAGVIVALQSLDAVVFFFTAIASLLVCSGRLVAATTHNAIALSITALCLSVSRKSARRASFLVGGCFWHIRPAFRAVKETIFGHINSKLATPQHVTPGAP